MSRCKHCGEHKLSLKSRVKPTCARLIRRTLEYYDWFDVMEHLESKHSGIKDRLWKYAQDWGVRNSIYLWVGLDGDGVGKKLRKDLHRLAKAIGVDPEDGATFHISW